MFVPVGWPSGHQSTLKDALQRGLLFIENRLTGLIVVQ